MLLATGLPSSNVAAMPGFVGVSLPPHSLGASTVSLSFANSTAQINMMPPGAAHLLPVSSSLMPPPGEEFGRLLGPGPILLLLCHLCYK